MRSTPTLDSRDATARAIAAMLHDSYGKALLLLTDEQRRDLTAIMASSALFILAEEFGEEGPALAQKMLDEISELAEEVGL